MRAVRPGTALAALEHDLQRTGGCRVGERVVRSHRVVEREPVRGEDRRVEATAGDQLHQLRDRVGVDQPGRHRHVADPELLEVERRRPAMHADVRDAPTGADQLGRELERLRQAHRLERDVGAEPIGELHDARQCVLATVVDRRVGAEPRGALEPGVGKVDRHDATGRVERCGEDRRQPDRSGADDRDDVTRRDHAVEHADLVGGREDVGEEQDLLVAELIRDLVDGVVRERDAGVLRLEPVDQVSEDPAAAAEALAVASLPAEAATPARADAGQQHPVADGNRAHARADLLHRSHGLVTEHRAGRGLRHIALEDVEVGAADRRAVDPDDDVRRIDDRGVVHLSQPRCPGPW